MSLTATPLKDGTTRIQVDYPYYLKPRAARYFQKHSEDEAREAANTFADRRRAEGFSDVTVEQFSENQHFIVTYHKAQRSPAQ
jgi:hypothetical protein